MNQYLSKRKKKSGKSKGKLVDHCTLKSARFGLLRHWDSLVGADPTLVDRYTSPKDSQTIPVILDNVKAAKSTRNYEQYENAGRGAKRPTDIPKEVLEKIYAYGTFDDGPFPPTNKYLTGGCVRLLFLLGLATGNRNQSRLDSRWCELDVNNYEAGESSQGDNKLLSMTSFRDKTNKNGQNKMNWLARNKHAGEFLCIS